MSSYRVHIAKASDDKRAIYAYAIVDNFTGKYSEHTITRKIKNGNHTENDYRAFRQIIRHVADQPNVHRVSFIFVNGAMLEMFYELIKVEETKYPYLNDSTLWLLKRFYDYHFEGCNGDEPHSVACIDKAMLELERYNNLIYRFKAWIKRIKGENEFNDY